MIYAVDFDGTLYLKEKGKQIPNVLLINQLRNLQLNGHAIILNTCRDGKRLKEAIVFCQQHGLCFNAVNQNLPQTIKMLGYDPRKIYADVYIDDKAMRP